jgi:hypothetical protein
MVRIRIKENDPTPAKPAWTTRINVFKHIYTC